MNYALIALLIAAIGLAFTFLQNAKRQGAIEEQIRSQAERMREDREKTDKLFTEHKKEIESKILMADAQRDRRLDRLEQRMDRLEVDIRDALEKTVTKIQDSLSETYERLEMRLDRMQKRED